MKRIGTMNIKELLQHRHGLGLTRAQTATAVGVSTGTVSHILELASCRSPAEHRVDQPQLRPQPPLHDPDAHRHCRRISEQNSLKSEISTLRAASKPPTRP